MIGHALKGNTNTAKISTARFADFVPEGAGFVVHHGTAYHAARRLFQDEVLYRVSATQ